ncbi:MAG: ATP-binding protein [Acetobacteraceae bacterium]|nr:ATP-binding protein [Acetobacteraceae bacterium]
MGQTLIMSLALTVITAGLSFGMALLLVRARVGLAGACAQRDRAMVAEATTMRTLRLAVGDLREAGMRLLGHAEQINLRGTEPTQDIGGILAMTRQLLDLADDMQDHAVPAAATRVLKTETILLEPFLTETIASVAAMLGPSRRHWRVASEVSGCALRVDRRALSQVLGRVLANAARESRHGDWIDISLRRRLDGVELMVDNEGAGLIAMQHPDQPNQQESRGLGFGLVLSRVLMEAHGGMLTIDPAQGGTRVTLRFPPGRVAYIPENVERITFAA